MLLHFVDIVYPVEDSTSQIYHCLNETDDTWLIDWPSTKAGSNATRKCNGIDAVG